VSERAQRQLSAILAADVAGYSRLIGLDEEGTLARLKELRRALIDPKINEHRGRIVKTMGDGLLVQFASVVDALRCAVEIQRGMIERNAELSEEKRIEFRMGINLGDIVIDGDDIYGDGVNVAARLEGLSELGGICVSLAVRDQVRDKLDLTFEDAGEQQLKNIARPVRVYRVQLSGTATRATPKLALPEKPSIAVLPFQNMSGDPEQQYFSDGITEDIITELSRFKSLPVIAHNSSAKFGSQSPDILSLRHSLDVDYVVQGRVRKVGSHMRITAQLVDARTGSHLWAERYDRIFDEVFSAQDEIVALIVGTVEGQLIVAGAEGAKRKPPSSMGAYDYVLRIMALPFEDLDAEQEGVQLLTKAIALDPTYGLAYALLAEVAMLRWFRDMNRPKEGLNEICKMAEKAVRLDDSESLTHSILSLVYLYLKSYDRAELHCERALNLTPNRSSVLASQCEVLTFLGRPLEAVVSLNRARQLDPYHAEWLWWNLGRAHYVSRQYADANAAFAHVMKLPFFANAYAAACHAQLGHPDLARSHADKVMQTRADFSLHSFMETEPFKQESDTAHLLDGLRKAGLPE
jgi:adenylate cyclase